MSKSAAQLQREIDKALGGEHADKFAQIRNGTLVRRSKHWYRVHPGDVRGQLGIVTGRDIYEEGGRLVTYPVIHWEDQHGPSGTHPDNAEIAPSAFKRARNLRGQR